MMTIGLGMMQRPDRGGCDMPEIHVGSDGDAGRLLDQIKALAKRVRDWIATSLSYRLVG